MEISMRTGIALGVASMWFGLGHALSPDLCAKINTSDMEKNTTMFQTNGACHDFCWHEYALAITQGNGCWCSNYAPDEGDQVSVSECDTKCPVPIENCGGPNLFGYLILGTHDVSGTVDGSSPATSTKPPPAHTTSKSRTTETTAAELPATSVVRTVTAGGVVKTVTIIPTITGSSSGDSSPAVVNSNSLSGGAIAGIVIGVLAAVALAAVLIFFFLRRQMRSQQASEFHNDPSARAGSTGGSTHLDMSMAGGQSSPNSLGNRSSLLQIDPRMDPFNQGLYVRTGSHESVNTLRDDHDYSRRIQQPKVLRATNPDPQS